MVSQQNREYIAMNITNAPRNIFANINNIATRKSNAFAILVQAKNGSVWEFMHPATTAEATDKLIAQMQQVGRINIGRGHGLWTCVRKAPTTKNGARPVVKRVPQANPAFAVANGVVHVTSAGLLTTKSSFDPKLARSAAAKKGHATRKARAAARAAGVAA